MRQKQKLKNMNTPKKSVDAGDFLNDIISDEPLTLALVLKGIPPDIQKLKNYLDQSSLTLIYKTLSYGHLYIASKPRGEHDKN